MKVTPPRSAERFLNFFLKADLLEEVLGDLEEKFQATAEQHTPRKAKLTYWFQAINYLRPFALQIPESYTSNYYSMYRNYFKIGYRQLGRNKGYSAINIGGLAVGMAVAMLIGLWVHDELTFDQYHENHDSIAQILQRNTVNGETATEKALPIPLKAELLSKYGNDFDKIILAFWEQNLIVSHDDTKLTTNGNFMENDVIRLFSLNMLKGTDDALSEPGSIIISETLSKKLFGKKDPMGNLMKIDNEMGVMVTGVYEDPPRNSSLFNLTFIAPWKLWETSQAWVQQAANENDWDNNSFQLYAQLSQHADIHEVSEKIKLAKFNNIDERQQAQRPELFLHAMNDWHLRSSWENGVQKGGLIQFVTLFGLIGILVLLLGCINFMNLSTAQSEKRAKEVGIRKTIGSLRGQLIQQFLTESLLVVFLAFVLAVSLVMLTIPAFNNLVEKELAMPFGNAYFWYISIGFLLFTTLLAGSYPALYLSSFRPITVLKGTYKAGKSALVFRKVLVVLQFTASIALIIGTILVEKQIQHTKDRPMGYDVDGTIMIWSNAVDFHGKFELLRTELKSKSAIVEMAEATSPLTSVFSFTNNLSWEGKEADHFINFGMIEVTPSYGQTIGWDIVEGRDFSKSFASDSLAFIINQKAADEMGLIDPLDKFIKWGDDEHARNYRVIGVVSDMLVLSPFDEVRPMLFSMSNDAMNCMTIKLNPEKSTSASLAIIEDVFKTHIPGIPFDYRFTDREHRLKFATEEKIGTLSGIFAVLAIFISCLGMFGMSSFVAAQRTKEIGIRKVLGASAISIWKMLAKDFVGLVLLSCFVAIPIAFFTLSGWLEGFEYRTSMHWSVFVLAGLGALLITILTVSYHAISSALRNPLSSLQSE